MTYMCNEYSQNFVSVTGIVVQGEALLELSIGKHTQITLHMLYSSFWRWTNKLLSHSICVMA